jgi:hypothetical protein
MNDMRICQCGCECVASCCGGLICGHRPNKVGSEESFQRFLTEWRRPPVLDPELIAAYEWLSGRFPELMGTEELRRAI